MGRRATSPFEKAKEETYSLFTDRCRELLGDFLTEKGTAVCTKCPEACTETEKVHKALRGLVERLTIEAVKRCDDKIDIMVCLVSPYLSSAHMLKAFAKGKIAKSLAREMENSEERLLKILRRNDAEA